MAEEPVAEAAPKRGSALPKLLLLIVVMLVVAVVVNRKDIAGIAAGRRTFTSVLYGKRYSPIEAVFQFPDPLGPEDAKIKAQVVVQEGNSCHEPLVALWMGIAALEPERLRVEFVGNPMELVEPGEPPPQFGCDAAALINGENKFELGEGDEKRTLYLVAPGPQGSGVLLTEGLGDTPEGTSGWSLTDLATILNQAIESDYGEEANLTSEAIQEAWDAAVDRIPRVEEDEAEVAGAA